MLWRGQELFGSRFLDGRTGQAWVQTGRFQSSVLV